MPQNVPETGADIKCSRLAGSVGGKLWVQLHYFFFCLHVNPAPLLDLHANPFPPGLNPGGFSPMVCEHCPAARAFGSAQMDRGTLGIPQPLGLQGPTRILENLPPPQRGKDPEPKCPVPTG